MEINPPDNCTTEASIIAYCRRFHSKLRALRNGFNKWHKDGLTEAQYDNFPNKVKNRFPYTVKPTDDQWEDFLKLYLIFFNLIEAKLQENEDIADNSDYWNPDFDGDIN